MKWRDGVQEYVRERGEGSLRNLEQARRECQDRERCRGEKEVRQGYIVMLWKWRRKRKGCEGEEKGEGGGETCQWT